VIPDTVLYRTVRLQFGLQTRVAADVANINLAGARLHYANLAKTWLTLAGDLECLAGR